MNKKYEGFSGEHIKYLKKKRRNAGLIKLSKIFLLFAIFGLWELFAYLELIDTFIMSSPSRIAVTVAALWANGGLFTHMWVTLYETLTGFLIATSAGFLIAVFLWYFETCGKILEPYIVVLNSLPKIALGPVIIIWFGAGTNAIIAMAVLISVVITVISMLAAFASCDEGKLLLLRSMGANKRRLLFKLLIPHSMPAFISVLKINVGMAWVGTIMGEYLVSKDGIGYLIVYGGQVFQLDLVMASTVILCVLAGAMYFLVALTEKLVIKWK